jgi:hypothetical protein
MRTRILLLAVLVALPMFAQRQRVARPAQLRDDGTTVTLPPGRNLAIGTTIPVSVVDGCPVLTGANQICVKAASYNASGSSATTTTVGTTAPGTSVTVASAAGWKVGHGIYIAGAGAVDAVGGTVTYASGGTATGTGYCIATASDGGGYNAKATVAVAAGVISGNLTVYAAGQGYASVPTTWALNKPPAGVVTTCSGSITTTGGSLIARNYIGQVTGINGAALTISPATTTSVSTGAKVQHDESAAFQAAINALATTGGKIIVPDGFYRCNAAPAHPAQANSTLELPDIRWNYGAGPIGPMVAIEIAGVSPVTFTYQAQSVSNTGSIVQTDRTSGALLGGWGTTGAWGNWTGYWLTMRNLIFRAYDNPSVTLIDATNIVNFTLDNVTGDTGPDRVQPSRPLYPNGRFLVTPRSTNAATISVRNTAASGFYSAYEVGEHCLLDQVEPMSNYIGIHVQNSAHSIYGGLVLSQFNAYHLYIDPLDAASIYISQFEIEDTDPWEITPTHIHDSTHGLTGTVIYSISGGPLYATVVGGGKLRVQPLFRSALESPHPLSLGGLTGWTKGGVYVDYGKNVDKIGTSWTGQSVTLVPPVSGTAKGGLVYYGATGSFPTAPQFNFTGRTISTKVTSVAKGGTDTIFLVSPGLATTNRIYIHLVNSTISLEKIDTGTHTVVGTATYSPLTHLWWRLREASGTVYADTSDDGVTWTNLASTTVSWALTNILIDLEVGANGAAYPGFTQFDLFTIQ